MGNKRKMVVNGYFTINQIGTQEPPIWLNGCNYVELPKGSIAKLIGRELKWDDEPVELVETNQQDKGI